MPLLRINAIGCLWTTRDFGSVRLEDALESLPPGVPVPILIHGFRYAPGTPGRDPHDLILSASPNALPRGDISWPQQLGVSDIDGRFAISFGWQAGGSFWQARAEAARAGLALAALITRIRALSPGRRVTVLAHSLGARVAMSALPATSAGDLSRVVMLYPALLRSEIEVALATEAGRTCEMINVTSRENRIFDLIVALLASGGLRRPTGRGLGDDVPGWVDLPLDCRRTLDHLDRIGFPIAARSRPVCHWSSYLRPGLFPLYRALIAEPTLLPLDRILPPQLASTTRGARHWDRPCGDGEFAVN